VQFGAQTGEERLQDLRALRRHGVGVVRLRCVRMDAGVRVHRVAFQDDDLAEVVGQHPGRHQAGVPAADDHGLPPAVG
jgi:hypothetical protein